MKLTKTLTLATAVAVACATGVVAEEIKPVQAANPTTSTQGIAGFGALGATTTLSIIAGVVVVGTVVAEDTPSTSTN